MLEKFSLFGKTALVTGAAGILGIEHCAALLEAGATVILTDISESALSHASNILRKNADDSRIVTKLMDVSNSDNIKNVANELCDNGKIVNILVNNAAIDHKVDNKGDIVESSRLENFSKEQWDIELSVGLTGAFLCTKIFGAMMANNGKGGVILNIASDLSVISPDQRLYIKSGLLDVQQPVKPVTYSVIKSGLIGLTRYTATYWADHGVRANALSPGGVFTEQDKKFVKKLTNLIPLGRMADRDEYRSAIQFLCSDASSYLNGQNIVIDGGRSVW